MKNFFDVRNYSPEKRLEMSKTLIKKGIPRISSRTYAFEMDAKRLKGASGIVINDPFSKNFKTLTGKLQKDIEKGFHPKIKEGTEVKSVFDHEMGHVLDDTYKIGTSKEFLDFYTPITGKEIATDLSRYALENRNEFIAEAWSEYINSAKPRAFAARVGAIMNKNKKELNK